LRYKSKNDADEAVSVVSFISSSGFSQVSSIKTFDFSTLYTTLPHDKLKTRLKEIIHKPFKVDDPAMYLSLHGVLWSLGIQYK
jgi:hypothetical protein